MTLKPICVPCRRFFRPERNGQKFIEGMPIGLAEPGLAEPENWEPYKLWNGDLWKCPGCGAQIIVGVCREPWSEHYMPEFAKAIEGVEIQINDC